MRISIFILIFGVSLARLSAASAEDLVVARGSSERIHAPTHAPVRITNGKIISVRDSGGALIVTGKTLGSTTLSIGNRMMTVKVVSAAMAETYQELKKLVSARKGLIVTIQNDSVVLGGELLRFSDWAAAAEMDLPHPFLIQAKMDREIQEEAHTRLRALINDNQLPQPTLMFAPHARALISGDKGLVASYKQLLGTYGFKIEESSASLTLEPMVEVSIVAMEMRKREMVSFGVQWPTGYEAQVLPQWQSAGELKVNLQAVEQNGGGRILASPTLLCRSGKEASFLAGGEFPIKILNLKLQDVVWKQYGVLLHVKPLADLSGRMSIALDTEVSTIDGSQTVDGVPGLLRNRIQSHFDLERSKTIALSGLIKNESSRDNIGLPLLSRIPILGTLFSSQDYQNRRTELVFFVTPRVVTNNPNDDSENVKERIKDYAL